MTMTYSPSNLLLPEEPDVTRDRSAISSRRVLYARLISARDSATTQAERERLEVAVKRCGANLIASTCAVQSEISGYPMSVSISMSKALPGNLSRLIVALNTLQSWLKKLRKDIAQQRRGKKRLIEASDALGRAHALSYVTNGNGNSNRNSNGNSLKKKRSQRILSSLNLSIAVSSDEETLRLHLMNAARYIEDARESCAFIKRGIPADTTQKLIMGSGSTNHHTTTPREEQLEIDNTRIKLDKHTNASKEQFVTLNAAIAELEIYILKKRDGVIPNNADNPPPHLDLLQLLPVQSIKL